MGKYNPTTDQVVQEPPDAFDGAFSTPAFYNNTIYDVGAYGTVYGEMFSIASGSSAYVGFTAATGGLTAIENIRSRTFSPTVPVPPSGLSAASHAPGLVSLAWTYNPGTAASLVLERSTDGFDVAPVGTASIGTLGYLDAGLPTGLRYFYRVRRELRGAFILLQMRSAESGSDERTLEHTPLVNGPHRESDTTDLFDPRP
jgi:hypothetical protein